MLSAELFTDVTLETPHLVPATIYAASATTDYNNANPLDWEISIESIGVTAVIGMVDSPAASVLTTECTYLTLHL
jgi:hypothetical protein